MLKCDKHESGPVDELLPHVIIFFEKCVIFHSSLLQLHIYAAAVYRHHFFDSTAEQIKINERTWPRPFGYTSSIQENTSSCDSEQVRHAYFRLLKRVDSFMIAVKE